ncbi:hypothetical protein [Candidatus Coxiella mudrowiae]|uniref:hypothetical protein n=1 Tax=Candidatus Coxiella mudrowiae TaxID=2054173 RepID=UPI0012FE9F78|nr:hypothetical protein [Candidatus Coxiella mudrowiae]
MINRPASVTSNHLRSRGLSIISLGSGNIRLLGMMKVNQITQKGPNHIRLRCVNATTLTIDSKGRGSVYLVGLAQTLYARLPGCPTLEVRNICG